MWTGCIPVIRNVPAEGVLLDDVGQPRLVGEEEGQVRSQDAVLHIPQHLHHIHSTNTVDQHLHHTALINQHLHHTALINQHLHHTALTAYHLHHTSLKVSICTSAPYCTVYSVYTTSRGFNPAPVSAYKYFTVHPTSLLNSFLLISINQGCGSAFIFAYPNPAVFLNAGPDPDPAALKMRIRIRIHSLNKYVENNLMKSFL